MSDNRFLGIFYVLASGFFLMFFLDALGPRSFLEVVYLLFCWTVYTRLFDVGVNHYLKKSDATQPEIR